MFTGRKGALVGFQANGNVGGGYTETWKGVRRWRDGGKVSKRRATDSVAWWGEVFGGVRDKIRNLLFSQQLPGGRAWTRRAVLVAHTRACLK